MHFYQNKNDAYQNRRDFVRGSVLHCSTCPVRSGLTEDGWLHRPASASRPPARPLHLLLTERGEENAASLRSRWKGKEYFKSLFRSLCTAPSWTPHQHLASGVSLKVTCHVGCEENFLFSFPLKPIDRSTSPLEQLFLPTCTWENRPSHSGQYKVFKALIFT